MIFVGLDLHKRYVTACALDALGQVIAEERRLATDLAVRLAWLDRLTGPVTVVLEATLYWAWLEQQLTAARFTVQVAHPYQVKLNRTLPLSASRSPKSCTECTVPEYCHRPDAELRGHQRSKRPVRLQ